MQKYRSWYLQAESDLRAVKSLRDAGHFSQSCFMAQQAAEKALKALAYKKGSDLVKSHSLVQISSDLKINGELARISRKLDLYYISARYPDALPDGMAPALTFDQEQATEALELAQAYLQQIKNLIGDV